MDLVHIMLPSKYVGRYGYPTGTHGSYRNSPLAGW